jgi:hypothetical protein
MLEVRGAFRLRLEALVEWPVVGIDMGFVFISVILDPGYCILTSRF